MGRFLRRKPVVDGGDESASVAWLRALACLSSLSLPLALAACRTPVPEALAVNACEGYVMQAVGGGTLTDGIVVNVFGDGCDPDEPGMHVLASGPMGADPGSVVIGCQTACDAALQSHLGRRSGLPPIAGMGCFVTGHKVCPGRSGGPGSASSLVTLLNGGPADRRVTGTVAVASSQGVFTGRGVVDYTACTTPACTGFAVSRIAATETAGVSTIESKGTASAAATASGFTVASGALTLESELSSGAFELSNVGFPVSGTISAAGAVDLDLSFVDPAAGPVAVQFHTDAGGVSHPPSVSVAASAGTVECTGGGVGRVELSATAADEDFDLASFLWYDHTGAVIPLSAPDISLALPPGPRTVRVLVQDLRGAMAAASTTVVVRDAEPPVFQLPLPPVTTAPCLALMLTPPTVTDSCSPAPDLTSNAPGQFPIGTTTVVWTATDDAGNQSTASQLVTSLTDPLCYPANDLCETPRVVTATPFHDAIDLSLASRSPSDPVQACTGPSPSQNGRSLWYRFTAPSAGTLIAEADPNQSVISIYTGSCGAFTERACHDVQSDGVARAQTMVTGGVTYTVEVARARALAPDPAPTSVPNPGFVNITFQPDPCANDTIPPVLSTPANVSVISCRRTRPVTVGQATATDNCPPSPTVTGAVVATNGVALPSPLPVTSGQVSALGFGTHTVRWTAADSRNTVTGDQTVIVRPALEASQSFVVLDRGAVTVVGGQPGAFTNAGAVLTQLGNDGRSGDIVSVAQVRVLDRALVTGSVISSGAITVSGTAMVTGAVTPSTPVVLPPLPTLPTLPAQASVDVTVNSGTRDLAPGSYRTVTVNGGTLRLAAGDYFFQTLIINPDVVVRVAAATRMFARTQLIYRSPLRALTGTALQPIVLGFAGDTLFMQAMFNGTLVAPAASVSMGFGEGLTLTGSFYGRSIQLEPRSTIACSENSPPFGN
jgi:hypothetical protein